MGKQHYLFYGDLSEIDPDVAELIRLETTRQDQTLILIPSESSIPKAVRDATGSTFSNIYAEGYPPEAMRRQSQRQILDMGAQLTEYRRRSDLRYYKGTEYANIIEALARRRVAEAFTSDTTNADSLYVNVQPLSGGPANNAVYTALLNVGDPVLGMDLITGGHLSHGSPVNRSGLQYRIISYGIDPQTELLNYERIRALAHKHRPRMIIGGFSSYPYAADWQQFRSIADEVDAYLLADVAHVAGLILAGLYPNPVGIADVVTFTTHKSLQGPRGAVAITHKKALAQKLDRAVFPGEQGGPHINSIAGVAVAMRIVGSEQFRNLQSQIIANAAALAQRLQERGFRIPHGGTNTHLLLLDCKSRQGEDGTFLSGDMAARILDLVGIVVNRQTIPGDRNALQPSGLRLGVNWVTQRGAREDHMAKIADIIADLLESAQPYSLTGRLRKQARAKVDFTMLRDCRTRIRQLLQTLADGGLEEKESLVFTYPHNNDLQSSDAETAIASISGKAATAFLHTVLTSDVESLADGETQPTSLRNSKGEIFAEAELQRSGDQYTLNLMNNGGHAIAWLRALSDGLTIMDERDLTASAPGPVLIEEVVVKSSPRQMRGETMSIKAYQIGLPYTAGLGELPRFDWQGIEEGELFKTPLHANHLALGARMAPFAGYEMPLWYSSVGEEHKAVRRNCGVFDVTHMGVYRMQGAGAERFLNTLTTNDVRQLRVNQSQYTFLLDIDGQPLDDLLVYRLSSDDFLLVVNAANDAKNWAWLNAVKANKVRVDEQFPARRLEGDTSFALQDLRAEGAGTDRLVDIALQGPTSREVLLSLEGDHETDEQLRRLSWAGIVPMKLAGFDLLVSRTGYTGERIAYELFVHPDQASALFSTLLEAGAAACGLAARDSLRIEAGLPLYGQELAGRQALNPADAGFGAYVKLSQPFFVGKSAFLRHERERDSEIVRFRCTQRGLRPVHNGDPLVNERGRVVGIVTSCSSMADGHAIGLAYAKRGEVKVGGHLGVVAGSTHAQKFGDLRLGGRVTVPQPIEILRRFPRL